ncbi:hypothetical protein [Streptomyces sp. NPDC057702]|uniref:hypothetical protein n=1 Tax=unclassified Streptomyces TaxID=2593676 RepID=UPI0036D191E0
MGWLSRWSGGGRATPAGGEAAAGPADPTSADSSSAADTVRGGQGWRELPPLQRTLNEAPLVADVESFPASLGTWQDASLTSPLGHLVTPDAPTGLGHGLATPAEPDPPVPGSGETRAAATGRHEEGQDAAMADHLAAGPNSPAGPRVTLQRWSARPLTSAYPLETGWVREVASLSPEPEPVPDPGTAPPGAPTSVGSTPRSAGVQRSPSLGPPPAVDAGTGAGARGTGLGAPLAGLPPTAQRTPVASTSGPAPSPEPAATGPAAGEPPAGPVSDPPLDRADPLPDQPTAPPDQPASPSLTAGPAPVRADAAEFAASRSSVVEPEADTHAARPLLGTDPLVSRAAAEDQTGPPEYPAEPAVGPPLSVARAAESGARPSVAREFAAGSRPRGGSWPRAEAVQRAPVPVRPASADGTALPAPSGPAPAVEVVAPLVAQRSVPVFSDTAREALEEASPAAADDAVPVRWPEPDTELAPPPAPRRAAARGSAVGVQRWAGPPADGSGGTRGEPGPTRTGPTPAGPTLSRTGPTPTPTGPPRTPPAPRRAAASAPGAAGPGHAPAPVGPLGTAPLDAGAVAVAAGVARRTADGSVVFRQPSSALPVAVGRDAEPAEPPPPDPPPDPEPEPDPEPGSGGDEPSTEADPAGGRSATEGREAGAPAVTDELVRALFAPLSRLLRAELRLERERAGYLIETRHR